MARWNIAEETKAEFNQMKREYESELNLPTDLSQDEWIRAILKCKVQILDVMVNLESVLNERNPGQEQEVPA